MKKLPNIYKNNKEPISHNKTLCHITKEENNKEDVLKEIFRGLGYPHTKKVYIKTKDKELETYLVSRNKGKVLTLSNELIPIKDIDIIKIKND